MSDEYEIHGPHDHHVEHAGQHDADPATARLAVMTAILASLGAIFSYQSGANENLALYYKNEAAILKTEAANQWAYYQSKGQKQNLAELGASLTLGNEAAQAKFNADIKKYKDEKVPILQKAQGLEEQVKKANDDSEQLLRHHHKWAVATTLIQISIGLTAVALLTRRRWLRYVSVAVAAAAVISGGIAIF